MIQTKWPVYQILSLWISVKCQPFLHRPDCSPTLQSLADKSEYCKFKFHMGSNLSCRGTTQWSCNTHLSWRLLI